MRREGNGGDAAARIDREHLISGREPWRRTPAFQDPFLAHVIRAAGLSGPAGEYLISLVEQRLAKGGREYGELGYLHNDVLGELTEEPTDVLGWALLAALQLYKREAEGMDPDLAADARQELVAIAVDGARLWQRCEGLRQALAER